MRGLIASMIIGTIFGWVWLFVACTEDTSLPKWTRIMLTGIAILLGIWITTIKRKTQLVKLPGLTPNNGLFKSQSYRLIVCGEVFFIVFAIFILKLMNLQNFIPSAIALIMALHFVLLGVFLYTANLKQMDWMMVIINLMSDIVFAPLSKQVSVENWILMGFGMGIILWANVCLTAIRIRRFSMVSKW